MRRGSKARPLEVCRVEAAPFAAASAWERALRSWAASARTAPVPLAEAGFSPACDADAVSPARARAAVIQAKTTWTCGKERAKGREALETKRRGALEEVRSVFKTNTTSLVVCGAGAKYRRKQPLTQASGCREQTKDTK